MGLINKLLYNEDFQRVENDQSAYAQFLFGTMPSAKESSPEANMQRVADNYRYTLY